MADIDKGSGEVFREIIADHGAATPTRLGPYAAHAWRADPRMLFIAMARYKFAAKILAGRRSLLEIGCGDAFSMPILLQTVERTTGLDVEADIIAYDLAHCTFDGKADYRCHDIAVSPAEGVFDAALSLDVIEHILPEKVEDFVRNIAASLEPHSPMVMGTPNRTAAPYASPASRREHVNLLDHVSLAELLTGYFHNVFIFSMNDEVVHTGFYPMAQYLMALAVDPRHPRR